MKKALALLLAVLMVLSCAACASKEAAAEEPAKDSEPAATDSAAESSGKPGEGLRIALVTSKAGTQPFIVNMIKGFKDAAEEYGYEAIVVECADDISFEDNMRALVMEGVDLLIGGGWQAGDPIAKLAEEFPDACGYVLFDSEVENDNVECISFRETESMYLLGLFAALVTPEDMNKFGIINVNEGPGAWKWAYGYVDAILSVKPDAEFVMNYTGSYEDPAKGKELALQQFAQGCGYICSCCSACGEGIKELALEKGFYTDDTDEDRTTPDNPYIVTSMLKDTYRSVYIILEDYFARGGKEGWTPEDLVLGVREGALGVVHVTHESALCEVPESISEEDMALLEETVEKFMTGELYMDQDSVPDMEEYFASHK